MFDCISAWTEISSGSKMRAASATTEVVHKTSMEGSGVHPKVNAATANAKIFLMIVWRKCLRTCSD